MDNICKEYSSTGRCRKKGCKYAHTREKLIESEICALCGAPAQCVTVCKHFFCYSCARGFITQSTKCVICDEETAGVVYITVNERPTE
ncbi:hypothetical protein NEMIN01_2179 [Nematocida minor]|uniref:uncharacterized protein n=1 Tax=Nematocida minor TaxID=1912983 RepID=UPI00221F8297|nr:uncharacterized protein NEMIN01_2179 [Nematocida minor]KAI5192734.1 hypothetical protein NEMIN01_2179 [Nematocida minor]